MRHDMGAEGGRERLAVAVFVPPGRSSAVPWREGAGGGVMVSEELLQRWETAYGDYGLAAELVANSEPGDRAVARAMARASSAVAAVWREIEVAPGLPWWQVAAVSTAAQAFEFQSRDWTARARQDTRACVGRGRGGPPVRSEHTA